MAQQSFYIALPNTSPGYPTHMSVPSSRTGTAFPIPEHISADLGSISYNGVTYSVYQITSDNSYYQVSSLTTYGDSWVHSENVSTNRANVGTYGTNPPTSTTHVWTYLGNAVGSTYGLSGATQDTVIFYQYYGTYGPSADWSSYGGLLVGGSIKRLISTTDASASKLDTTSEYSFSGLSASGGVRLIELYTDGALKVGVFPSPITLTTSTAPQRYKYIHDYSSQLQYQEVYVTGSGSRKVYAIHHNNDGLAISLMAGFWGSGAGTSTKVGIYGCSGGAAYDTWDSLTGGDGHKYFAITCKTSKLNGSSTTPSTTMSVTAGYTYTFKMHTNSEASYDGILIKTPNNSITYSTAFSSAGDYGCSGLDVKKTTTYNCTTSGTVTIYFKTDSSNLYGYYPTYNNSGVGSGTRESGYTCGDVEVIITEPAAGVSVTLSKNGGTGGTNSVSITTGTTASNYPSIISPTRANSNTNGPNFRFDGYWTATSGGTQYYDAGGYGTRTFSFTTPQTWYAQWYNAISYEPSEGTVSYSSSDQYATVSSVSWTCSTGSVTYVIEDVYNVTSGGTVSNSSSWITSGAGQAFKVPGGTAVGRYLIRLILTSTGSSSGNTYKADEIEQAVFVNVTAQSNITITLDKNGGSNGTSSISVAPGASTSNYPSITAPSRGTFEFDGYYTTKTGGTECINSECTPQVSAPSSNTTWYAHWINKLTYNPNTSISVNYGTTSATIASTGWTCSGGSVSFSISYIKKEGANVSNLSSWSVNSTGTTLTIPSNQESGSYAIRLSVATPSYTSGNTYIGETTLINISLTIGAQSNITITFDKNGGTGGSNSVSMAPNCPASQYPTITLPTRSGVSGSPAYDFDGYWTATYDGTEYFNGSGSGVTTGPSSSRTLYAHWINTVSYTVDKSTYYVLPSTAQTNLTISSGGKCASGGTITYSVDTVRENGALVDETEWGISSDGKTLIVPGDLNLNSSYYVLISAESNYVSTGSGTYESGIVDDISFNVIISNNNNWIDSTTSLVGGVCKREYTNTQTNPDTMDESDTINKSVYGGQVRIVEFYHNLGNSSQPNLNVGLGAGISGLGLYSFTAQKFASEDSSIYRIAGTTGRIVLVNHQYSLPWSGGGTSFRARYWGTATSGISSNPTIGYVGYSSRNTNEWITHTAGDGKKYYAISVTSNSVLKQTTLSATSGKTYIFNVVTYSEAGADGIIITETPISSSPDTTPLYGTIGACSGVKVKKTLVYSCTSSKTIYIYFLANSDLLAIDNVFDSNGNLVSSGDDHLTFGNIEVFDETTTNPPTFNNQNLSVTLKPSNFTTSLGVVSDAFTAATAKHGGVITYSIVSVNGGNIGSWILDSETRKFIVPQNTPGGTYAVVVRAAEAAAGSTNGRTKDATITITVNKKSQTAPTATGATSTYATSGSISGSASGGGCTGNTIKYKSDAAGGTNYGTATTTAPSRSRDSVGTTTFVAFWPGNDYWEQSSNSNQASLVINPAAGDVGTAVDPASQTYKTSGTYSFTISMSGNTGTVTYPSSFSVNSTTWSCNTSTGVVTVPAGTNAGTYTITGNVTCAASSDGHYAAVTTGQSRTWTITLTKKTPTLTFTATSGTIYYDGTSARVIGTVAYNGDGTLSYAVRRGSTSSPSTSAYASISNGGNVNARNNSTTNTGDVGTYYVWLKCTAGTNYAAVSTSKKGNKAITARPITVKAKDQTKEYDGSVLTADNTVDVTSSLSPALCSGHSVVVTNTGEIGPGVSTGTKTLGTVVINNSSNTAVTSNYSITSQNGTLSITKKTITITAPTFVSGTLTYNGSSQNLVNAGSCTTGGTMYYYVSTSSTDPTSFSTSTWSTTVPAKTDSGQYFVWYYCYVSESDTANYTGTNINTILEPAHTTDNSKTINKATLPTPVMTSGYLATYNGSYVNAKASVSSKCATPSSLAIPAGKIYYGTTSGASTYNVTASTVATSLTSVSRSDVGSISVYAFFSANDPTNYASSAVSSTTVKVSKKATNTVTYAVQASSVWCGTDASARSTTNASKTVTIATSSASATAGSITYAVTVKSGTTNISGWSVASDGKTVTTSAATPAGTYTVTVTATASATTNYSSGTKTSSSTVTVSAVSLSSVALELSASSVAYNGTTGVSSLIATYNNSASKNITSSIGISTNSNPKIVSDDTTIATIS